MTKALDIRRAVPSLDDAANNDGHKERLRAVVAVLGKSHAAQELLFRLQIHCPVRSPSEVADDAARIAVWEAEAAPALQRRRLAARHEAVRALDLPITSADEILIATGTTDEIEVTRSAKAVRRWFEASDKPLLVLAGPPGRGKTVGALHLINYANGGEYDNDRRSPRLCYVRAPELARLSLAAFGEEVEQRDEITHSPWVVVVDDIGTERNAEAMCGALTEQLDYRRCGTRSIWITNLERAAFEARYPDQRLHSRMAQSALWVIDNGEDLRRRGSA